MSGLTVLKNRDNKVINVGVGRRPSDNLLKKLMVESSSSENTDIIISRPKKSSNLTDRHLSDNSVETNNSNDVFSQNSESTSTSPNSEINSRLSSINNNSFDKVTDLDVVVNEIKKVNLIEEKKDIPTKIQDPNEQPQMRYIFSNPAKAQSQINLGAHNGKISSFGPLKNNNNNNSLKNRIQGSVPIRTPTALPGSSSKFFAHSNSTTAILNTKKMNASTNTSRLTPSQKFRMRRANGSSNLRKSIKGKEKFYEEQEQNMDLQEGDIDGSLIWNIPMASLSTSSFLINNDNKINTNTNTTTFNNNNNKLKPQQANSIISPSSPTFKRNSKYGRNLSNDNLSINSSMNSVTSSEFNYTKPPSILGNRKSAISLFSNSSNNNQQYNLDFSTLPPSPIPGVDNMTDFQYMENTSRDITSVYLHNSSTLSQYKLTERTQSADTLPLQMKDASDQGMEDLLLVSGEKMDLISSSRPSWLPPKDSTEKKLHEEVIRKTLSCASMEQLEKGKDRDEQILKNETNRQKYILLLNRGITRNSSIKDLKKIILETNINDDLRFSIYNELLQSEENGIITEFYMENFDNMMHILNRMQFPKDKELEIERLISKRLINRINCYGKPMNEDVYNKLYLLLQLKSISSQGLCPGDELLFYHLLLSESHKSLNDVWKITNLIQMTCFNDKIKDKFNSKILDKNGISGNYLFEKSGFELEFNENVLNFDNFWNIFERIEHELFMWILDFIIIQNGQSFKNNPINKKDWEGKSWEEYKNKRVILNYKILISLTLNVLLNYHFGYNDLKSLGDVEDSKFCIPIRVEGILEAEEISRLFIGRWQHYYKRF